ncbi:MAG: O-antigen ligase family protein [Candidatus Portnoybacteria bacterium]|nr:O-antigen ligase family protein [Candidatus Portnoybacteria bacterium]
MNRVNDLYKLVLLELIAVALISIGILDRTFAFLLLAILAAFILTKPFKESLELFLLSLPFYIALPVSTGFDSMSMWRPLSLLLVILWLWEKRGILWEDPLAFWDEFLRRRGLLYLTGAFFIFIFIATISLLWASDIGSGVKAIIYFINIFLILFIYAWELTHQDLLRLIKRAGQVSGFFLFVGFLQFAGTFFVPLYEFWQWWAAYPISAYYGSQTSNLVSYSNTWFSYYSEKLPATLRIFSLFQDSHAFAMFTILGASAWGTLYFLFKEEGRKKGVLFSLALVVISLLAIILSGARGSWVAAGLLALILLVLNSTRSVLVELPRALVKKSLAALAIFFLLFPISSILLAGEQKAQLIIEGRGGEAADLRLAFLRARSAFDIEELSNKGRIEIWEASLIFLFKNSFLTGTGIGNFPTVIELTPEKSRLGASAHSLYLQLLVELGLFGLLAFFAIIFLILKQAYKILALHVTRYTLHAYYAFSFLFAFLWVLLYSLVDVTLLNDKVFLFAAILIGILYSMEYETSTKTN